MYEMNQTSILAIKLRKEPLRTMMLCPTS